MSFMKLPKDGDTLREVLWRMMEDSKRYRIPFAIEWYVSYHYLRGARFFESVDYKSGSVTAFYEDTFGHLPFRYEDILRRYADEVGRLMRLDLWPSVERGGMGLMTARNAAVAHVLLDNAARALPLDSIKLEVCQTLPMYGTVGGCVWEVGEGREKGQTSHVIDVVPPWELLPLPANPMSDSAVRGMVRQRWVSYDWLKDGISVGDKKFTLPGVQDSDLMAVEVTPEYVTMDGSPVAPIAPNPIAASITRSLSMHGGTSPKSPNKTETAHVQLSEIWVPSETRRLARYIVMAGKCLIVDVDFDGKDRPKEGPKPVMPISKTVYTGGLGFYGRSFVGPLVTLNAEVESMFMALFRNVQDLDQFGYLFYPEGWGIPRDALEEAKPGRRIFSYRPDPSLPDARVQAIQPVTSGELPGRIAQLGIQLTDKLAGQPTELMSGGAPGRVESAKGIDILYQTSTVSLGGPAMGLATMFGDLYRAILWNTKRWPSVKVNTTSMLDDVVVGLKFDPSTGEMSLQDNAVPDPFDVVITIRSKEPVDKDKRIGQLAEELKGGIITAREFRLINRKENLGLPTGNEVEWQNYMRAVINSVLMFGDGQTPGPCFSSDYDIPAVHEYVLLARMSSPEFSLASPEVQQKFAARLQDVRALRGAIPNALPPMEDAAQASVEAAEAQQNPNENLAGLPPELAASMIAPGGDRGGMPMPMPGPGPVPGSMPMPGGMPPDMMRAILSAGGR